MVRIMKRILLVTTFVMVAEVCTGLGNPVSAQNAVQFDVNNYLGGPVQQTPEEIFVRQKYNLLCSELRDAITKKNDAEIISYATAILNIRADDEEAWTSLADLYERQGKQREALYAYRSMMYSVDVNHRQFCKLRTRMKFVICLCKNHLWEEATKVFGDSNTLSFKIAGSYMVKIAPFNPVRWEYSRLRSAAHLIAGIQTPPDSPESIAEGISYLKEAIRLQPQDAPIHLAAAEKYLDAWRMDEYRSELHLALKLGDTALKARASTMLQRHVKALPIPQITP